MKQKTQYKQTPIGLIPTDWEVKKLGEIIKLGNGKDYKHLGIGNVPVFGTGGIITYVDDFLFEGRTVGIGRKGSIDKPVLLKGKFWTVDTLFYIKEYYHTYVDFVYSLFQSINWMQYNEATGLPSLSQTNILNIKIPLPPLPEQQKIAEILSNWDKAIQEVQLLIKKLEVRNKALAFSLLTGKKRVKGFEGKWEIKNFGKIISRVTKKNEELNDTVVTISAKRGFILQEDFFNKRVASDTLSGYYLLKKGQFAYNKSYSNGYPMGVFKRLNDFDKAVVTTLYICFELKENICSDFMVHYFDSGLMNNNLMKIAKEGGRAHGLLNIGIEDFMNLKITMPSLEEQTAIAAILNTAQQELKQYQEKLKALQQQKKGLMQQLLTGKLRTI